jgi:hypothetical protein
VRDFRALNDGLGSKSTHYRNATAKSRFTPAIETASIGGRRPNFLTSRKLTPDNLGLLQQYLPQTDVCSGAKEARRFSSTDHLVSE